MNIGDRYNWKHQKERLVFIGKKGVWNQFAKTNNRVNVWCEVLDEDLHMLEQTNDQENAQMNIGDKVQLNCILRSAGWVGKSRPVIKYEFDDANGNNYVAFSTANWLKDVDINAEVQLTATVSNMSDRGIVLNKPRPIY